MDWSETIQNSRRLVGLGLTFMWSGLLVAGIGLATRSLIIQYLGLGANGIYQAAWGISGMFAGFILSAMYNDFYPRLTAVANENRYVNRLVREQTEIGVLLALPGLLGTLTFAPWIMHIFYSEKFLAGAELLPWFVLGVFGRVVSCPMGFILLAKGKSRLFAVTETASGVLQFTLTLILLRWLGLWGVALAFTLLYVCYFLGMTWLSFHLTGFLWTRCTLQLLLMASALIAACFAMQLWLPDIAVLVAGAGLTSAATLLSLRGIAARLGADHRLIKMVCRIPGGRIACGQR